jgi:hypothetical protein
MLTKHITLEKIHSAYQLECGNEILKVMGGGQGRDESHFVERECLDGPLTTMLLWSWSTHVFCFPIMTLG